MRLKTAQPVYRLLQGNLASGLLERVAGLSRLQRWLENQLPCPLNKECRLINLRGSTLVLAASSPVWASRLRFLAPRLQADVMREFPVSVQKIQVKVQPVSIAPVASTIHAANLSPAAADLLLQTARSIDHEKLRTALTKLAAHTQQS